MAKISKPDANPVVALVLSLFFQLGHVIVNGQKDKFIKCLIAYIVAHVACCVGGPIVGILGCIDAYKTAVKLKAGKEVDEHEYSFKPFFSVVKIFDKQATLVE